ncbi:uncharacterized protein [Epargyreus clarus]|uniref:uncharacterized protein n=1 Tax=Epargyreus clarus TaxID=520877 RepID=UPI003C2E428A
MPPIFLLLFLFLGIKAENANKTSCGGFQANFDVKSVVGTWYVVAIIPEKLFPENTEHVTCYRVEFSETDEAGLRWLVNSTLESKTVTDMVGRITGTIIRQRYFSERPFDVWSKTVGVKGCFQQLLALDTDKSAISKAVTNDAIMQLHLLETSNGPFLLQMLWGKMVSAVIYRRKEGVTQDQLKPAFEFMSKLRGPQRLPRICAKSLRDIITPHSLKQLSYD